MTMLLPALAALVPLILAAPLRAQIPDTFTNLQVLPTDVSRDSLIGVMRRFSFALGVRCQYCHVGGDGVSFEGVRFADDDDEDKRKARYMLRMVRTLNDTLLAGLPDRDRPPRTVDCVTCHGGLPRPTTLEQTLAETIERDGADSAVAHYRRLREAYYGSAAFDFTPQRLMELARTLAFSNRAADGIRMLELNAEMHPRHAPNWHQLAETHLFTADTPRAIAALGKVLELQPQNAEARRRLEQIRR